MIIICLYMYGAMVAKYVGGAESFVAGISYTLWEDMNAWEEKWPGFDPYYLGLILFGSLSMLFSFGNIENSKTV